MSKKENTKNGLFVIVKDDSLKSFETLETAVAEFSDFASFVIEGGRIVELTLEDNDEQSEWNIKDVSLVEIAKGFKDAE